MPYYPNAAAAAIKSATLGAKQIYNSFHHSYFIPFGFIGYLLLAYHPFHVVNFQYIIK